MARRATLAAVLLAVLGSLVVSAQADPSVDLAQPVAAVALTSGGGTTVAWVPGAEPVQSFQIYGVKGGTLAPLTVAGPDQTSAQVPVGFPQYAVTAWHDGTQTNATLATAEASDPCLAVYPGIPPDVAVSVGGCLGTHVEINFWL